MPHFFGAQGPSTVTVPIQRHQKVIGELIINNNKTGAVVNYTGSLKPNKDGKYLVIQQGKKVFLSHPPQTASSVTVSNKNSAVLSRSSFKKKDPVS